MGTNATVRRRSREKEREIARREKGRGEERGEREEIYTRTTRTQALRTLSRSDKRLIVTGVSFIINQSMH